MAMSRPVGPRLPLSLPRRFIGDLMHAARDVPLVVVQRRMRLAEVAAARSVAAPRPSWCALFLKAFAFVAAAQPTLRRSYQPWPRPHLYEHPENIASVCVEREYHDEPAVFIAHLRGPESRGLQEIEGRLKEHKDRPVEQIDSFRKILRTSRLPGPLRRLLWWYGLNASGYRRAKTLGTFGVSALAGQGADLLAWRSPLAVTLNYGVVGPDGGADVRMLFDHRVLDSAAAARALHDVERVLRCEILSELRYFEALDAA
jgi:hypothetical protein